MTRETSYVGQSLPRVDATARLTDTAIFPADLSMPGMLHLKTLFAERPHARIATNSAAARDAIGVEFEDLPVVTDAMAAMPPGAQLIHPERGEGNVCAAYTIRKGDVEAGFAQADVIVESEYQLPFQEHAFLQPEAGIAFVDDEGRVTVEAGGQWAHADQKQIAHALGLSEDQVRVVYSAIGGAFGGREDMSVQIVLALAALKLRRPVKTVWSRRESIFGHGKRHPMKLRARRGATGRAKLVAAEMKIIADAGAYPGHLYQLSTQHKSSPSAARRGSKFLTKGIQLLAGAKKCGR